ncbi:MAG: antitoxin CptB [Gammaproteobacteria bacterium]|jgi:antitoxin CptB
MTEISRLRWLCRRGMKELDLVLNNYLDLEYPAAMAEEQRIFHEILELQDPDLYSQLLGRTAVKNPAHEPIILKLKSIVAVKSRK